MPDAVAAKARLVAEHASRRGLTVAVAESLTSGRLASALGEAPDASEWFRGAVVAYASAVKFDVLGVTPGPVVTASCAREMATGARNLLAADVSVAGTGVGPAKVAPVPQKEYHQGQRSWLWPAQTAQPSARNCVSPGRPTWSSSRRPRRAWTTCYAPWPHREEAT